MSLIPQIFAANEGDIGIPRPTGMNITDLGLLVSKVITTAFILAGILVFAFLVWGGVEWILSGGDKQKTETARNRITAALVGLAIVAASYAIMKLIAYFFGFDFENAVIPRGF